jgi:predicted nucleic acid-binding protein
VRTSFGKNSTGRAFGGESASRRSSAPGAEIELLPTRSLFETATRLSIEIGHPAYDCLYLDLAVEKICQFVTTDERFLRRLQQGKKMRASPQSDFADRNRE